MQQLVQMCMELSVFDRFTPNNKRSLHQLRIRLAQTEALPQLTLLGILTGLLAGGVLILFRELIELTSSLWISSGEENFESLSMISRFFLPVAGALLLILLIKSSPKNRRTFGISHVIERLTFNRGHLPVTNMIGQFFGALIALISGFSVGREGPAVHLGAGAGSQLGQKLHLPDNTLKALAGCGGAAAISASFNTPLAGVIFAMEVILKEYSLGSFIPVMAASVSASVLSQFMYGPDPAFQIPAIPLASLGQLTITALTALVIGCLAASFIKLNLWVGGLRKNHIVIPLLLAGLLMGTSGALVPESMGIGYDTVESILNNGLLDARLLLAILIFKLVLTASVTGLGVPGGIIGPSLVIGAATGALFGVISANILQATDINIAFHALLGMVAMMAAVLQAPLAALVTVLELTRTPHIIMPAMFAIIVACLVSSQLFRQGNFFTMQFKAKGKQVDQSPLHQLLSSTGVASLMDTGYTQLPRYLNSNGLDHLEKNGQKWVFVEDNGRVNHVMESNALTVMHSHFRETTEIDLLQVQSCRKIHAISMQATLQDTLKLMNRQSVDMLSVLAITRINGQKTKQLCGLITRKSIDRFYLNS